MTKRQDMVEPIRDEKTYHRLQGEWEMLCLTNPPAGSDGAARMRVLASALEAWEKRRTGWWKP